MIEFLEQTGALRALLLTMEKPRFITELIRSTFNPEGIASMDALKKVRFNLAELGLVTETIEDSVRPKTFLVITDKGKLVAEKVKEIQEILESQ